MSTQNPNHKPRTFLGFEILKVAVVIGFIVTVGYPQVSGYLGERKHERMVAEEKAMESIVRAAIYLFGSVANYDHELGSNLLAGETIHTSSHLLLTYEDGWECWADTVRCGYRPIEVKLTNLARERLASGEWRAIYRSPDSHSLFFFVEEKDASEYKVRAISDLNSYFEFWDDIRGTYLRSIGGSYLGARYSS